MYAYIDVCIRQWRYDNLIHMLLIIKYEAFAAKSNSLNSYMVYLLRDLFWLYSIVNWAILQYCITVIHVGSNKGRMMTTLTFNALHHRCVDLWTNILCSCLLSLSLSLSLSLAHSLSCLFVNRYATALYASVHFYCDWYLAKRMR
jgi:hypothetical protein